MRGFQRKTLGCCFLFTALTIGILGQASAQETPVAVMKIHHLRADDAPLLFHRITSIVGSDRLIRLPNTNDVVVFASDAAHGRVESLIKDGQAKTRLGGHTESREPISAGVADASKKKKRPDAEQAKDGKSLDRLSREVPLGPIKIVHIKGMDILLIRTRAGTGEMLGQALSD